MTNLLNSSKIIHADMGYFESPNVCGALHECSAAVGGQSLWSNATHCSAMDTSDSEELTHATLLHLWQVFWTIVPILFFMALAQLATQRWTWASAAVSWRRFLLEFIIITLPTVLCVNVANDMVTYLCAAMGLGVLFLMWRKQCVQLARTRDFEMGHRPTAFTLCRTTVNFLTAFCILAVDFESFPGKYRKSRQFGASLMDVGIGLFAAMMGLVSRRPRRTSDLMRLLRVVAPVLLLGLARTVVIIAIDYHQDEHEYGVHLNAFFTLGFTKFFGAFLSGVVPSDALLLPLGIGTLVLHECLLQMGISDFVMDKLIERTTFITANREGLCSLPGFVAIYILSMYLAHWIQAAPTLNYSQFKRKLKSLALISLGLWLVTVACVFVVGIARVTCNFGYVTWMFAIILTMMMLFMFIFELVLNTIWPIEASLSTFGAGGEAESFLKPTELPMPRIPVVVEAINHNGLVFFLIANVLTGGVNIFLRPEERSDSESVFILTSYMFVAISCVYILHRLKIKIG